MDLIRSRIAVAVTAILMAMNTAVAQAALPREVIVGVHALVSSRTLPAINVGLGGSVDLYSHARFTLRFSTIITAPIAYLEDRICLASPGGACFDGTPKGAQLATFVADAVVRLDEDGTQRAVVSLGRYVVNPSIHNYGGGWLIERKTDFVAGIGYERLFGGAAPRYAFTMRYLRYTWVYQQNPWAGTIGISRLFRFD